MQVVIFVCMVQDWLHIVNVGGPMATLSWLEAHPPPNFSVYLHMRFVSATLEHECPKTFETSLGAPAFTTSPYCCSMHGTQQKLVLDGAGPVVGSLATDIILCKLQCCWRSSGSGSTAGVQRMRKHKLASIMVHDCRDAHVHGQVV